MVVGFMRLVGGSVPVFDEVVLNLSAMNKILSFDEVRTGGGVHGADGRQRAGV